MIRDLGSPIIGDSSETPPLARSLDVGRGVLVRSQILASHSLVSAPLKFSVPPVRSRAAPPRTGAGVASALANRSVPSGAVA